MSFWTGVVRSMSRTCSSCGNEFSGAIEFCPVCISTPGAFAGTPEFASPEQFAGVGVDIRSDLYSLGVTIWQMLTGKTPFRGTPGEVMYQHQQAALPIEQLEGIPQPVVTLLEVLLEKNPACRFQNPADFLKAISTITWFGDRDPRLGTAWEKGERLAKLIAHCRTLLVLDGLEPLQNPPGPQEGRLRETALQALLRELAAFNTGLCVVTTRLPVADIAE